MAKKVSKAKTVETIESGECRWPIGDPRHPDFHFCGAQQVLGRPYCQEHWHLSYDASKSRPHAARPAPLIPIGRAA